ncbi:AzlD domain-containing protein [Methanocaldococcus sp. 16A]
MKHYLAILVVSIGTYLMRLLPIIFNTRFKKLKGVNEFFAYSSSAIISALFVTSLVSFPIKLESLSVNIIALIFVFLSYKKWKNFGISILIGVVVHLVLNITLAKC